MSQKCFHFLLAACLLFPIDGYGFDKQAKTKASSTLIKRDSAVIDANQISMVVMNNGTFGRDPMSGSGAFFFPKGTDKKLLYTAGIEIAGKVNGDIRTACANYNVEFQPGKILSTGVADDPDLEKYRIYKIKPGDSADPASPNYNIDYAEWPVEDGAPVDASGSPLILGDQTMWLVMNDANESLHSGCYNTEPFNLELQLLVWAFDDESTAMGKTVFMQYTLINKSQNSIEDAYVGIWSDADVGDSFDDALACDTTLDLTYAYNGDDSDMMYGTDIPAVGICLLQGPAVPSIGETAFQFLHIPVLNARNLNMTSTSVYY
ncbi:MAG: hypothetical protein ACOY90_06670 [Candidatus Zhuqueibacterota bacterium]